MTAIFAIGVDPSWSRLDWSALELDVDGRPRVLQTWSLPRRDGFADSDWLEVPRSITGITSTVIGTHPASAKGVEDIRGPLQAAQRMGRSSASAQNGLVMMGACVAALRGARLITPQVWRAALQLPSGATKQEAWATLARLCGCEVKALGSNEHQRDASCIAYAAAVMRRDEL
jgi:hypothetical protein